MHVTFFMICFDMAFMIPYNQWKTIIYCASNDYNYFKYLTPQSACFLWIVPYVLIRTEIIKNLEIIKHYEIAKKKVPPEFLSMLTRRQQQ